MKYINAVSVATMAAIVLSCVLYINQLPIDIGPNQSIETIDYVSRDSMVIYSPPHDSDTCVETELMDSALQAAVNDALGNLLKTVAKGHCATLTIIHP